MSTSEHHQYHEGYREDKEAEETQLTVSWAADVLKYRYIDGEVTELHKAAEAFDNPVLGEVLGLDPVTIEEMKRLIHDACDKRTAEGLADLNSRLQTLDEKIRFVATTDQTVVGGEIHAVLERFQRIDGDMVYPVAREQLVQARVIEMSYKGERQRI